MADPGLWVLLAVIGLPVLLSLALLLWGLRWRFRRLPPDWRRLRVNWLERPTPDLLRLRLRAPWSPLGLPGFAPGQHLILALPSESRGAKPPQRAYSLAQWQPSPRHYELLIRREPLGKVSSHLYAQLKVGQCLDIGLPRGHFHPPMGSSASPQPLVLVAGGVGITPMLAMAQWAASRGDRQVYLFWAVRHVAELVFAEALWDLVRRSSIDVRLHVSGETLPALERQPWHALLRPGRLTVQDIMEARIRHTEQPELYLCAGSGLSASLRKSLLAEGWPEHALHEEAFAAPQFEAGGPHQVQMGGQSLTWRGGNLLALLETQPGLAPPSECRAGSCGQCRMTVEQGQVHWLLPKPTEIPASHMLACICAPASDLRLKNQTAF